MVAGSTARSHDDDAYTGDVPAVLVFHGWEGRSSAQAAIARQLAELGYAGVACDLFGDGLRGEIDGDNTALIEPLLADRPLLRDRLLGSFRFARDQHRIDRGRIAAIGFCFGGLCALDLARSGVDVRAVASFHGMFSRPEPLPITPISASVAVFHGWDDPMAPPEDLDALGRESTEADADWQVHAYGTRCTRSWRSA